MPRVRARNFGKGSRRNLRELEVEQVRWAIGGRTGWKPDDNNKFASVMSEVLLIFDRKNKTTTKST